MRHSFAFSEMHTEVFKGKMQNVCYLLDYILAKKKKKTDEARWQNINNW